MMARAMRLARYLFFPILVFGTGGRLLRAERRAGGRHHAPVLRGAMTFFMWILVPTFDHEGTTAPIDPDFELPED